MANENKKILIVDDEPDFTELASTMLGFHGFETTAANDPLSVEATLDACHYDLIVTDIMMPGLDGFKFERPTGYFANDGWINYWLLKGNQKPYNTNVKIKEMDFDFLITTLKSIFAKHTIIVQ